MTGKMEPQASDITDITYVCLGDCLCLLRVSMPLHSRPWPKQTALIFNSLETLEGTRDSNQPHSVRLIRWEAGVRENLRAFFVHFWAEALDGVVQLELIGHCW